MNKYLKWMDQSLFTTKDIGTFTGKMFNIKNTISPAFFKYIFD